MELRIGAIADYASLSIDQKLNILGVFGRINALAVPHTHPQMYLVYQIDFDSSEVGKKDLRIVLQDEDGRELLGMGTQVDLVRPPAGRISTLNQIVQFNGVTFPRFGSYEFCILINERVEGKIPIEVVQAPAPPIVPPTPPSQP